MSEETVETTTVEPEPKEDIYVEWTIVPSVQGITEVRSKRPSTQDSKPK